VRQAGGPARLCAGGPAEGLRQAQKGPAESLSPPPVRLPCGQTRRDRTRGATVLLGASLPHSQHGTLGVHPPLRHVLTQVTQVFWLQFV
jgi:hypothetical protein